MDTRVVHNTWGDFPACRLLSATADTNNIQTPRHSDKGSGDPVLLVLHWTPSPASNLGLTLWEIFIMGVDGLWKVSNINWFKIRLSPYPLLDISSSQRSSVIPRASADGRFWSE